MKNEKEEWKKIIIDGLMYPYLINRNGVIVNKKGQPLKPFLRGKRKGTYPAVDLYLDGIRRRIDVHRVVAIHFVENRKPGIYNEVNHLDLNHMNYRADNLEWTNRRGNMQHSYFMRAGQDYKRKVG